ncbi:acid phosphatase/Vanadium-dependent haloperoxidase [Trametes cingulata]|nr:acid phosphatase/Vanadium-dependent haloperoxidase [Trametes cingulata]
MFPSRRRRSSLVLSYAPDWIVCIVLAAAFYGLEYIEGFKREFSLTDTSYTEHERVPPVALYMICGVAPLVLQPVINALTVRSWWDLHSSWLGLLLSLSITGGITQFVKITVGRPRPDLIARCIPRAGAVDPPLGLSTVEICTQTHRHTLQDGWRSFPSGHSSLSFAGLGFLSFYLAGKLHLFDTRGHTVKAWLALTPLSGAALVAISRTMDYRHHWHDVLAGSLLGLVTAYFSYRQYYPPLHSDVCHKPYPPRTTRGGQVLPTHTRDDSDTSALANVSLTNGEIRPRSERRYSDRPSIGDEEAATETATGPTMSTDETDPRKEAWREQQQYHGSV